MAKRPASIEAKDIDIGIPAAGRKKIVEGLNRVLADTYGVYLKTHGFHWNVTGPHFNSLHAMFMIQYTELWNATDLIAERIRSLGHMAPASYAAFSKLTAISEELGAPDAMAMVDALRRDNETVARTCKEAFPAAEREGDQPTMDLLTQRIQIHEKTAWMLRSIAS
jgi:starvation-inducible DNA-binding protein